MMEWRPVSEYRSPRYDTGAEVLLAWKHDGDWVFGVGYGHDFLPDEPDFGPQFTVGEWTVLPSHFAVIEAPR
jgi:hypothetical protein